MDGWRNGILVGFQGLGNMKGNRGKDGGSGTVKQRDVDRWMIMGFFSLAPPLKPQ